MKKTILLLLISILSFSCKEKSINIEYQFSDKPDLFQCDDIDMDLIKEAVYSFEKDIIPYLENRRVHNLQRAYNLTVNFSINKSLNVNEIASDHTKNIFKALKQKEELWNISQENYSLNYNSKYAKCFIDNFFNNDLKATTTSLVNANSMSKEQINSLLLHNYKTIYKDNGLRAFIALDYFYADFFKHNN